LEEEVEAQGIDEGAAVYESYTTITDDTETLSVEVPTAWSQTDGSLWLLDGETIGVSVVAAANVDNFLNSWTESGVRFRASSTDTILELTGSSSITTEEFLDIFDWSESCTFDSRVEYTDPLYTGSYDLWTDCGGEDVLYLVLSATPEGGEFLILVEVQIYTDADIDALQHIFDSFIATSE
jgi:serine protease Do